MADRRVVLDSELNALLFYLISMPLDFLGVHASECAKDLAAIIEEHLESSASFVGFDFRDEDEY